MPYGRRRTAALSPAEYGLAGMFAALWLYIALDSLGALSGL